MDLSPSRRRRGQGGFTLMEAMVTIGILGFVSGVLTTVYLAGVRGFSQATGQMQLLRDGRTTMDLILRRLREAQSTTVRIGPESPIASQKPRFSELYFVDLDLPHPRPYRIYQEGTNVFMRLAEWDKTPYPPTGAVDGVEVEDSGASHWTLGPPKRLASDVKMLKFFPRYDYFSLPGTAILSGGTITFDSAPSVMNVQSVPTPGYGNILSVDTVNASSSRYSGVAWGYPQFGAATPYPEPIPYPLIIPGNPPAPQPRATPMGLATPVYPGDVWAITGGTTTLVPGNYICQRLLWVNATIEIQGPGAVNVYVVGSGDVVGAGPNRYLSPLPAVQDVNILGCVINQNGASAPDPGGDSRWFNLYLTGVGGTNAPAVRPLFVMDSLIVGSLFVPNVEESFASSVHLTGDTTIIGQVMSRGDVEVGPNVVVNYDPRAGGWAAVGTRLRDIQVSLVLEKQVLRNRWVSATFAQSATLRNSAFHYR